MQRDFFFSFLTMRNSFLVGNPIRVLIAATVTSEPDGPRLESRGRRAGAASPLRCVLVRVPRAREGRSSVSLMRKSAGGSGRGRGSGPRVFACLRRAWSVTRPLSETPRGKSVRLFKKEGKKKASHTERRRSASTPNTMRKRCVSFLGVQF